MHEKIGPLLRSHVLLQSDSSDGASKILLRFADGVSVEAVSMPGTRGRTVCISTQVGCPVRCTFCASGLEGLERNLSAGEILEQMLQLQRTNGPFQRMVVMGMGDAGHNLEAVLAALDSWILPDGAGFSARRITLSTVAPRGALARLAEWGRPITLALSLHAPEDDLRHQLVPGVAKRTIAETLAEADALFAARGREYTVEYVLLAGVNDAPSQASALADLLHSRRCHVNLIPWNSVTEMDWETPSRTVANTFAQVLAARGIPTTLRHSLGGEANAACGQLRRQATANENSCS